MRTRRKQALCVFVFFFLIFGFFSIGELPAASYYEGKTITIVVGYSAGGGYDLLARLLAKHLPKYIPGKPTIIVVNMPGASSMIAANHLYNIAKPDGLTIGTFAQGLTFAQLLKAEGTKFDLTKYSWIGSAVIEPAILTLRTDLPYKTVDDLRKAKTPIYLAIAGSGSIDYQFPVLLKEYCGFNFEWVAYDSGPPAWLAVERKEADGRATYYGSSAKNVLQKGLVRPIIRGRLSEPGLDNLPVDEDLTNDKTGKTLMAMRSAADRLGRPYACPPGVPAEITDILKDAFSKVAEDPDLKEDSKKIKITVKYTPADECLKALNYVFSQPEHIVREFSKYIKF